MEGCAAALPNQGIIGHIVLSLLPAVILLCAALLVLFSPQDRIPKISYEASQGITKVEEMQLTLLDGNLDEIKIPPLHPQAATPQNKHASVDMQGIMDANLDVLKIPALEPERRTFGHLVTKHKANGHPSSSPTTMNVVPWTGGINWAMRGASIFDNSQEERDCLTRYMRFPRLSEMWFFQYGLRYIPTHTEQNIYRTLRIEELPRETTDLSEILPYIKGEIYSARLINTTTITGYMTVLIVFLAQHDAMQFLLLHHQPTKKSKSPMEGRSKNGKSLPAGRVVPVNTPTYPISSDLDRLIVENGYTRFLSVCRTPDHPVTAEEIQATLDKARNAQFSHQIECIENGSVYGEIYLKFLSIRAAANGLAFLKGSSRFWMCQFRFHTQDGRVSSVAYPYMTPPCPHSSPIHISARG